MAWLDLTADIAEDFEDLAQPEHIERAPGRVEAIMQCAARREAARTLAMDSGGKLPPIEPAPSARVRICHSDGCRARATAYRASSRPGHASGYSKYCLTHRGGPDRRVPRRGCTIAGCDGDAHSRHASLCAEHRGARPPSAHRCKRVCAKCDNVVKSRMSKYCHAHGRTNKVGTNLSR